MTVRELIGILAEIPDDLSVVVSDWCQLTDEHTARRDQPIHRIDVDEKSKECCLVIGDTRD